MALIAAGLIAATMAAPVASAAPATSTPTTVIAGSMASGTESWVATQSISSIERQIKEQSDALEDIVEKYNGVAEQLKVNQQKEIKLSADIAPTLRELDAAHKRIAEIAAQAYMAGPTDSLTTLVSSDSTSDLLDQMTAMDQLAAWQTADIRRYAVLEARYNEQKQQLDGLIVVLNTQQKGLAEQKSAIKGKLAKLYKLRRQAYGSASENSGSGGTPPKYLSGRGGAVVKFAYAQLGKPYVWAADGPGSYDCSGLTLAAYRSVGVSLYHKASVQWTQVHHLSRSQLKPGDLVFYRNLGHVAIYIGGGKVIHAPTFGEVVKISSVDMMSPYGYGRP